MLDLLRETPGKTRLPVFTLSRAQALLREAGSRLTILGPESGEKELIKSVADALVKLQWRISEASLQGVSRC